MTTASRVSPIGALGRAGLFISAAMFAAMFCAGMASAATTIDIPSQCAGNASVLTVTQQITEADTGLHGTWATDTFTETANVYPSNDAGYAYCAVGTINAGGTFSTTGPLSPQNGVSLASGISGSITGGETWLIPAGATISASTTGSTYTATPVNTPTEDSKFSNWQNEVFGSTVGANSFSFTYATDADAAITWLNDGAGNSGDITNPTMTMFYVDATNGNDTNIGSQGAPFKTLEKAVATAPSGGTIKMTGSETLSSTITISQPVTIDGQGSATLVVPSTITGNDALDVKANDVTIQNLKITGPADGTSYLTYAWGSTVTRGIFVYNGYTGFNITGNTIQGLRNDILVDGRNSGSITGNTIDNSKSGISVQYTDAGTGNSEGYTIDISGNQEGSFGNEWGVNMHLNGHYDGATYHSNSDKIAAAAPSSVQSALQANSTANHGWTVQDQGYSTQNRTAVTVSSAGSDSNQGSKLNSLASIQAGVNAVISGGTVNVLAGTYAGNVVVTTPDITVTGAGVGSSIINLASGYGISLDNGASTAEPNFTMSGFTVNSGSATTYAFKAYKADGLSLSNMDFEGGSYGGGVDLNTTSNVTITNVKAAGFHKNGFAVTSAYTSADSSTPSSNITFNGVTASNNGWAGVALYTIGNSGGSANIGTVTFTGTSTISGNAKGVEIVGDTDANVALGATPVRTATTDGTTLNLSTIAFSGNTAYDVVNYQTAPVNAVGATFSGVLGNNMNATQRTTEDGLIYDQADNAALGTVTYFNQTTTTNSDGTVSTEVSSDETLSGNSTAGSSTVAVTVTIPAGTTITGDSTWDGSISAPTTVTISLGSDKTVGAAIEVGSSGHDLTFDQAVKLVFAGQAGKSVGFKNAAGVFSTIDGDCPSPITLLPAGSACKTTDGSDLVVYTKHFSTFVTFTTNTTTSGGGGSSGGSGSSGGGGGGGGGGAPAGSITLAAAPQAGTAITTGTTGSTGTTGTGSTGGQVLGAATYNFRANLTVGSKGVDVEALQQILVDAGFLDAKLPHGYFGGLTKAAVIKWQQAHNITPASGYVGVLTRAALNAGSTPTSTDEQKSLLLQSLNLQLNDLMARLNALMAGTTTATTTH